MKSNSVKSIAYMLVVGVVLILLSVSFTANSITDRGIVIGLGVDYADDRYTVTAEIVSPGGEQDQQVGTFSKIIQAEGDTVAVALTNMYAETGSQISLGQCQILLLGQSVWQYDMLSDVLPYFVLSDEYKDSSALCCVYGDASSLMLTQLPLSKSISFTLVQLLKQSSVHVSLPNITLSRFVQSSLTLSHSSMCPIVQYTQQPDNTDSAIEQCSYYCYDMAIFDNFGYVCASDEYTSIGYTLLDKTITGQVYTADNQSQDNLTASKVSVSVTAKKVDIDIIDNNHISINIRVSLQEMSHTDIDNGGALHPQVTSTLTQTMLDSVRDQIAEQVETFLQLQAQYNVDVIGLYKALEIEYGVQWIIDNTQPIDNINIALVVDTVED